MAVNDPSELTGMEATVIARLVASRTVSPVDVVRAHLDRIALLDGRIGAFELVMAESALEAARALEGRSDLDRLPLAGVPVAIKDNVDVSGAPTRHGSRATSPALVRSDDELVRRLRAAGAVVVGKTRLPELAIWPLSESETAVLTRNPWNAERTAGGSSSGGAAAVAAGMVPLALGSDGGGSIRVPAACCGVLGIKPGPGVVPVAGRAAAHWLGLTEFGPLARSPQDVALMLDVLAGSNSYRDVTPPGPLRIALGPRAVSPGAKLDPAVEAAIDRIAVALSGAGHEVCPDAPHVPRTLGIRFCRRWLPGIAEDAARLRKGSEGDWEPRTRGMIRAGAWLQRRGLATPVDADRFGASMRRWLSGYDVLVTPTLSSPAVPLGRWRGKGWVSTMLGVGGWINTSAWNLAQLPAMTVPLGLSKEGLPLAGQLVALPGKEATLLALAHQIAGIEPPPRWRDTVAS